MGLITSWFNRTRSEMLIDAIGLIMQSFAVPVIAAWLGTQMFPLFLTWDKENFQIPLWIQVLLPFTLVDYAYYWNHRFMHNKKLWWIHRVHHTSSKLDIFVTSRNSIWTVFFFVYLWTHSFLIFTQQDPSGFVFGMLLLAGLDLWRHSGTSTPVWLQPLGYVLILPEDHEWHHSNDKTGINFGANLNLWDRWHGTFYRNSTRPTRLGESRNNSFWLDLFYPWREKL